MPWLVGMASGRETRSAELSASYIRGCNPQVYTTVDYYGGKESRNRPMDGDTLAQTPTRFEIPSAHTSAETIRSELSWSRSVVSDLPVQPHGYLQLMPSLDEG